MVLRILAKTKCNQCISSRHIKCATIEGIGSRRCTLCAWRRARRSTANPSNRRRRQRQASKTLPCIEMWIDAGSHVGRLPASKSPHYDLSPHCVVAEYPRCNPGDRGTSLKLSCHAVKWLSGSAHTIGSIAYVPSVLVHGLVVA